MKRREFIAPIGSAAIASVIGAALISLPSSSANAQQPPWPGCVKVTKAEYDNGYKSKIYNRLASQRWKRNSGPWSELRCRGSDFPAQQREQRARRVDRHVQRRTRAAS